MTTSVDCRNPSESWTDVDGSRHSITWPSYSVDAQQYLALGQSVRRRCTTFSSSSSCFCRMLSVILDNGPDNPLPTVCLSVCLCACKVVVNVVPYSIRGLSISSKAYWGPTANRKPNPQSLTLTKLCNPIPITNYKLLLRHSHD